ncbi:hypothetical protein T265_14109, partial [Opisthorchis viverrini]
WHDIQDIAVYFHKGNYSQGRRVFSNLLDCKRFITNRGDNVSALSPALTMSPRLVMKRLQSNCQARAPELPTFQNVANTFCTYSSHFGPSQLLIEHGRKHKKCIQVIDVEECTEEY